MFTPLGLAEGARMIGSGAVKAYLILFRSRYDRTPLGWGINSEYPLSVLGSQTGSTARPTEQDLILVSGANTYEAAEFALRRFIGIDLRYLCLSKLPNQTYTMEGVA
jgi:hypothetical protein